MFGSRFSFWEKKAKDDTAPKLPVIKKTEEAPKEKLKRHQPYTNLKQPSTSSKTILSQLPDIEQQPGDVKVSEWVTENLLHASASSNEINCGMVEEMVNLPSNNLTAISIPPEDQKVPIANKIEPNVNKVLKIKKNGKDNIDGPSNVNLNNGSVKAPCFSSVSIPTKIPIAMPENKSDLTNEQNKFKTPVAAYDTKSMPDSQIQEPVNVTTKSSIPDILESKKKLIANSDPIICQLDEEISQEIAHESEDLFVAMKKSIGSLQNIVDAKQNETKGPQILPFFECEENGESDIIHVPPIPGVVWSKKDQVWFITKQGITRAYTVLAEGNVPDLPEGKVRIQITSSLEVLMVSENRVEMANEEKFDRIGDIATLRNLNESSMLHTLSQRYEGSLNYSFVGPHLISLSLQHNSAPGNFTHKVKSTYKSSRFGDTPPHIYATAQHAHQSMMSQSLDQSIISLGHTASGKTENLHHIFNYFASISMPVEKLNAILNILNSFTSTSTNDTYNSSRCVQLFTKAFDKTGQLNGVSVQAMFLDKSRLVHRKPNDANFNIFYQLLHGSDANLRRELFLIKEEHENNPIISFEGLSQPQFTQHSIKGFVLLQDSFKLLGVSSDEAKAIYHLVAASIHLGIAGVQKLAGNRYQFTKADSAQKAASLLGVTPEKLNKEVFSSKRSRTSSSTLKRTGSSLRRSSSSLSNSSSKSGLISLEDGRFGGEEMLNCFIISLYSEVFKTVLTLVNRINSTHQRSNNSILVLDAPGFPVQGSGATFSDLTFNYLQDRLHGLYQQNVFTACRDRYFQEEIDCDITMPEDSYLVTSDLIDEPPTPGGSKGLLWLLNEEISGNTDQNLIDRLVEQYSKLNYDGFPVLQRSTTPGNILISHQSGNAVVEYDTTSWQSCAYYNSITNLASDILHDSKKPYISQLFGLETLQGSISGLKIGSPGLRRAASMRKGWNAASGLPSLKKSTCLFNKFQTDGLIDTLKRSKTNFIFSIKASSSDENNKIDVSFVRNQIKGFNLLSAARLHKQGYPDHMAFYTFRQRFDVLLRHLSNDLPRNSTSVALLEDKEATENILNKVELSRSQFKLGVSQVLLRSGVLNMLEDKRNEKVSSVLITFQAQCRGYLARKRLARKKVQVVAVRCIQRNVRKFMEIRQWPWWKLLTKVLPLVEVTRTEEELREKQAEIELLQEKLSRVELERDDLIIQNTKVETKTQDLVLHLEEERAESLHTTDILEHETKERIKLEKLLKDSQALNEELRHSLEDTEVELAEKRLVISEQNHNVDSDSDLEDIEYKGKYERTVRECNFKMKKQTQEHEDQIDDLKDEKKSMDRKLIQFEEEMEELKRIEQQHRKKYHRVAAELSDTKIHLEEMMVKNQNLEKKQRKFDSELYGLQADLTEVKSSKEKALREKDRILLEKNEIQREYDEKADDIEILHHKIQNLEIELKESTNKDTDDRQMVNKLKKQLRELETQIKDQEEELDEQASTIHILEQSKDRLEMSAEQARQQRLREVEGKEEELEEMRSSYHKRIKQMEIQLEEEGEERNSILKQKRSVEEQMAEISNSKNFGHDVEMERRLKRDLKRYKVLLADAQTMIDHYKDDGVNKHQMKQLKAQLEDLQYTSSAAVKSRKAIELEVDDLQAQLEEVSKGKQESENQVSHLQREVHQLRSKMEEDADDSSETLRKYKGLVTQQSEDKQLLVEAQTNVEEVRHEKAMLSEKLTTLQNQIEYMEGNMTDNSTVIRLENKAKDLETKLEFQKTASHRLEVQLSRAKENVDKLTAECDSHSAAEHREKEALKRVQRKLREAKEEQGVILKHEQDALQRKHDLEMQVNESQSQIENLQSDLKLAFKRISDLQLSFEDSDGSEVEGTDEDSSSDEDGWRTRTYSSRLDEAKPFTATKSATIPPSSVCNVQRTPTKKKKVTETSPIEDSMSKYGQKLAKSLTKSVASNRTRSLTRMSNLTRASGTSSVTPSVQSEDLDRMSLSLADEDPSLLLYGKVGNISNNLGLGQAKSFQALNESLRAVKLRQNLPEAQREQISIRNNIEGVIKRMKLSKSRNSESDDDCSSLSSRNSVILQYDITDDLSNDSDDSVPVFERNCSKQKNSIKSLSSSPPFDCYGNKNRNNDEYFADQITEKSSKINVESPTTNYIAIKAQNEVPGRETAKKKPFVSRFLNSVRKHKSPRDSQSNYEPSLRERQRSVSQHRKEEESITAKKVLRCLSRMSARDIEQLDLYMSDSDEYDVISDDVSLAKYGIAHSPGSSMASSKISKRNIPPNFREGRKIDGTSRSRSMSRQSQYSARCSEDEFYDIDVDQVEPVCLDSIISKYLYKKS